MTLYDYKVVPAPRQVKRVKGVKSTAELFSATLAEAINAAARDGWEYLRAESLPAEEARGWFRRGVEVIETVLVFRRPRESLGPRIAARRSEPAAASPEGLRPEPDRAAPGLRREPRFAEDQEAAGPLRPEPASPQLERATPFKPAPRLGPADAP